jgi:tetratricopeptide (TPR) repeat protein
MDRHTKVFIVFVLLLFGAAVCLYSDLWQATGKGSFEHVRKARKYLQEGKYKKALLNFNRAYECSPGSKEIKENLLYGYLKYARELEYSERYNDAEEQLSLALGIDPGNAVIANNLAIVHAEKAVEWADKGEMGRALGEISGAVRLAFKAPKIRKNISNFLLNSAIDAFMSQNDKTVILCLNISYLLKARAETLDLLGEFYYRARDLERAVFYWKKALARKPGDDEISGKITRSEKESALESAKRVIDAANFKVEFYQDYKMDTEKIRSMLEKIYKEVGEDLGYFPGRDTKIILYSEKDFSSIFGKSDLVRGFYDGNIRLVFDIEPDDPMFAAVIAHEYAHALVSILTDSRCPVWLHEGIAVYEEARYYKRPLSLVKSVVGSGGKLSIENTDKGFRSEAPYELGLSYESACTAVLFAMDKWGSAGIKGLLARLKEGAHYANAIDDEFLVTIEIFEKMWNEYARQLFAAGDYPAADPSL